MEIVMLLRKLFSNIDRKTQWMSFLFSEKDIAYKGSLFVFYSQKVSFLVCFFYGMLVFFLTDVSTVSVKITWSYIAIIFCTVEIVFFCVLFSYGRKTLCEEVSLQMNRYTALVYVIAPSALFFVTVFLQQYFFVGTLLNTTISKLIIAALMACISGVLYPLVISNVQLGIIRLLIFKR